MAAKKHKAAAGHLARPNRKKNPFKRHHARRHNPLPTSAMDAAKLVLSGAIGGLASAYVPNLLLRSYDSGLLGYLANAAVAFIPPIFLSKHRNLAIGWMVGGGTMVLGRIVDDITGKQYIVYQAAGQGNGTGVGSFFGPGQYPLPAPSVFSAFARGRMALPAAPQTVAAGSSPTAIAAAGSPGKGMGWVRAFGA